LSWEVPAKGPAEGELAINGLTEEAKKFSEAEKGRRILGTIDTLSVKEENQALLKKIGRSRHTKRVVFLLSEKAKRGKTTKSFCDYPLTDICPDKKKGTDNSGQLGERWVPSVKESLKDGGVLVCSSMENTVDKKIQHYRWGTASLKPEMGRKRSQDFEET